MQLDAAVRCQGTPQALAWKGAPWSLGLVIATKSLALVAENAAYEVSGDNAP
jgi:hypothetical protein